MSKIKLSKKERGWAETLANDPNYRNVALPKFLDISGNEIEVDDFVVYAHKKTHSTPYLQFARVKALLLEPFSLFDWKTQVNSYSVRCIAKLNISNAYRTIDNNGNFVEGTYTLGKTITLRACLKVNSHSVPDEDKRALSLFTGEFDAKI